MPELTLTFGRYRLEPQRGLMSGARNVHLTPKALALLSFIAERPGEVVIAQPRPAQPLDFCDLTQGARLPL